jgi:DNA invertase Pin-like site-specific DNA recombinase
MAKFQYRHPALVSPEMDANAYTPRSLPTNGMVVIYYRQSTEEQVGNISTVMQTDDMVSMLKNWGWSEEKISLNQIDAGVSGTKKIDERLGMRMLFEQITDRTIAAVACQEEDRLFRDASQVEVNKFIVACKENDVMVLTPTMRYDFSHKTFGDSHIRMFRQRCESAADVLMQMQRRMNGAKDRMSRDGLWTGGFVPPGYMVDMRKTLDEGIVNPSYRRYVPYAPIADIIPIYFQLFLEHGGNLRPTLKRILTHGPFFPPPETWSVPVGFKIKPTIMRDYGNGYCPSESGLNGILTNVAYIGHWAFRGAIIRWNNHPGIVPVDTFMKAFNYLSAVGFDGEPNPDFHPVNFASRPSRDEKRDEERPLCAGMIFTEFKGRLRKVGTQYDSGKKFYRYGLVTPPPLREHIWRKKAACVDQEVSKLLLEKLKVTFDQEVWSQTLKGFSEKYEKEKSFAAKQLAAHEAALRNLTNSLDTIEDPDLIRRTEERFKAKRDEYNRLKSQLDAAENEIAQIRAISLLKEKITPALECWDNLSRKEMRVILHSLVRQIIATPLPEKEVHLSIQWRDGSSDELNLGFEGTTFKGWRHDETVQLLAMVDNRASQVEICAAFPERTWHKIRERVYRIRGRGYPIITAQPIKARETYGQYLERINDNDQPHQARQGEGWKLIDEKRLVELLDRQASQVEICEEFPHRRWRCIRAKITKLRGREVVVPGVGELNREETFEMYRKRVGHNLESTNSSTDVTSQPCCWRRKRVSAI